jgi:predicted CXXCH cytochrome family protein
MLFLLGSTALAAEPQLYFDPPSEQTTKSHFIENTQCLQCHAQQGEDWQGSQHAHAMALANEQSVKGDFNNVTFTHHGVTSTFFRSNDDFLVNTIGPDGKLNDFKISYTFGVEPLQQYIIELNKGHLQALDIAWDTREKELGGQKWFRLNPQERAKAGEASHWTGRANNWNNRCAECHSTNVKKNYDLATDSYKTTWSEINVSCQSCHGPGEAHAEWATLSDANKASQSDKGLVVDHVNKNSRQQVDSCARCHSRRHQVSADDKHGRTLLDDFMPSTLREGLYHADGQILDEVFVYGSFVQSKMYAKGVSCLDCHNAHTTKLKLAGNKLCLQCHQASPPQQRFPSLQANIYDSPKHHFHKQGSAGAQCVSCHMPATTYMEVDPRRDHSFNIPNPSLSQKINTPNACNSCHQDKSNQWAMDKLVEWFGEKDSSSPDPAVILHVARHGDASALPAMIDIINNPDSSPILTATFIEQLVNYFPHPDALKANTESLQHPEPIVRAKATSNLEQTSLRNRFSLATPLLDDPSRAVRIQAARVVGGMPAQAFGEKEQSFNLALQEYIDLQNSLADTPEAHINLGVLYTDQKQFDLAEQEYKHAIRLAPEFVPAYINLGNLYNRLGRNSEAENMFREAIKIAPDTGEIYYSLGLLLAEQQRYSEALAELATAKTLLPGRLRIAYNYALALQQVGQYAGAEAVLKQIVSASAQDPDMVYALITLYAQQQQWELALPYAKRLVELTQGAEGPTNIYNEIKSILNK